MSRAGSAKAEMAARLMAALALHAHHMEAGGSDSGSSDGRSVHSAELALDQLLDRMTRAASGRASSPDRDFYQEHGIDPDKLPKPVRPVQDQHVSFAGLLKDLKPVSVEQLQAESIAARVQRGNVKTVQMCDVVLIGRLLSAGTPVSEPEFATWLHIQDVAEGDLKLRIVDETLHDHTATSFAQHVALRYPKGTADAVKNVALIVHSDGFLALAHKPKQHDSEDADVFCLGDAELPPLHPFQVSHTCSCLLKGGYEQAAVAYSVRGLQDTRPALDAMLVPLLNNLAVAHLRLSDSTLALAYATAAQQLLFQATPAKAANVAVQVLTKLGSKEAAFVAAHWGKFEAGDDMEVVESLTRDVLKGHVRGGSVHLAHHMEKAAKAGSKQMAEVLAKGQDTWAEHALGAAAGWKIHDEAAASLAAHGSKASEQLRAAAGKLFRSSLSTSGAVKDRKKVHQAILKWRAALWLTMDPSYDRASFSAWDTLESRHRHWDKMENVDSRTLTYLDLVALAMMNGEHINTAGLRRNITTAKHKLLHGKHDLREALKKCASTLDIDL